MAVNWCGHVVTVEAFTLIAEAVGSCRGVRCAELAHPVGELLDGCRTSVALTGREGGARPETAGTH